MAVCVAVGTYAQHRYQFNWNEVIGQFHKADWRRIAIATVSIYAVFVFRSVRWAYLSRQSREFGAFSFLGAQVIGFTAVALVGRVADPLRPYLVAKKTGLPIANQFAVYVVERVFDMGTIALFFSVAMLWIPTAEIMGAMSYSASTAGIGAGHPVFASFSARYSGFMMTLLGASFLIIVRFGGEPIAIFFGRKFGLVSKALGDVVANKIRTFRAGLFSLRSINDVAVVGFLSLAMWLLIAFAYFECCRAFIASPELATITPQKCVLLMVVSGGASVIQLPVFGWFTQIIAVAAVLSAGFGVAKEAATAGAVTLLLVTTLSFVPVGLIWAHFEHVSLRSATIESECAEEEQRNIRGEPIFKA